MRLLRTIVLLVIICVTVSACQQKETEKVKVFEGEIVSVNIETRLNTNGMGGVIEEYQCLKYLFVQDDGSIGYEEYVLHADYTGYVYEINLMLGEENKIVKYEKTIEGILGDTFEIIDIHLTKDMYNKIFDTKRQ